MALLIGIGNPLMDLIMQTGFESLEALGAVPGSMNLVDVEQMKQVVELGGKPKKTPGGSCANALRGLAWLSDGEGERPLFLGAVGNDEDGTFFSNELKRLGVEPAMAFTETSTGKSAILVTPDYERTMFTFLGACRDFSENDIDWEKYSSARYLYTTGYMWDTENQKTAVRKAMAKAKEQNATTIFDLADPFVVHRFKDELIDWLPGKIDILFANREELSAMSGEKEDDVILEKTAFLAPLIVMKTGAEGCIISSDRGTSRIPGKKVVPIDTTAAGDSFAGGFLYGFLRGFAPEKCGRVANRLAAAIVTVEGCDFSQLSREEVLNDL